MYPDERKESAVSFVQAATEYFAKLGVTIERVITDNGSAFRSTLSGPPVAPWASDRNSPAPTDPRPTARPSDSSSPPCGVGLRPCHQLGPAPRGLCRSGITSTTGIDPTTASAAKPQLSATRGRKQRLDSSIASVCRRGSRRCRGGRSRLQRRSPFPFAADGEGRHEGLLAEAGLEGGHVFGGFGVWSRERHAALGEQGAAVVAGVCRIRAAGTGLPVGFGRLAGWQGQLGVCPCWAGPALLEL